jgi:hypothetical protein
MKLLDDVAVRFIALSPYASQREGKGGGSRINPTATIKENP